MALVGDLNFFKKIFIFSPKFQIFEAKQQLLIEKIDKIVC